MKVEQAQFERIENYLNGTLDHASKVIFEQELSLNDNLKEEVDQQVRVNNALHFVGLANLSEQIGNDLKNIKHTTKSTFKTKTYLSAGILSVSILGVLLLYTKKSNKTVDNLRGETKYQPALKKVNNIGNQKVRNPISEKHNTISPKTKSLVLPFVKDKKINIDDNLALNQNASPNHFDTKVSTADSQIKNEPVQTFEKEKIVPICDNIFVIKTTNSCKNESDGKIEIKSKTPSTILYEIVELNKSTKSGRFDYLESGSYTVKITDQNTACVYEKEIYVGSKWCQLNKNYSFNPNNNETWKINFSDEENGTYSIFDDKRQVVKSGIFGTNNIEWDGKDNAQADLPMGLYQAIIDYNDGRKEFIQLTIIRN